MSYRLENPTVSARVQEIPSIHLFRVHYGHKELGREKQQSPVESRRGYTDDSKRMFVQLDNATHHAAIILKMAVPKRVGEYDIRGAVRAMLVGRVDQPP